MDGPTVRLEAPEIATKRGPNEPSIAVLDFRNLTVDPEVASFLYDQPNVSAVVCEAVRDYRARKLEEELEKAYREDAVESSDLAAEWEAADPAVDE